MQRLFASLLVVALAFAPALHLWCSSSCAVPAQATTSGCHGEHRTSGPTIASTHDCLAHAQAPALVAKPASTTHVLMLESGPSDLDRDLHHLRFARVYRADDHPTSSPPGTQSQLRI